MLVAYARASTLDQQAGLDAQLRDLQAAGAERVFSEQVSSVNSERPELTACLSYCREGDTLVITKLDRLARSITHLLGVIDYLEKRRISLRILSLGIDTSTPTGRLVITVLGGIAEFERSLMLERQKEGIAKAQAAGKYKGRKPVAHLQAADILALRAQGLGTVAIAARLRLHRTSVYRVLREHRVKEGAGIDFDTLSEAPLAA